MRRLPVLLLATLPLAPLAMVSPAEAAVKISNGACGKAPRSDMCRMRSFDPKRSSDPIPFTLGLGADADQQKGPATGPGTVQQR